VSPAEVDREVVAGRLRLLRQTLEDLRPLGGLEAAEVGADAVRRAAIERFIQVLVDLAADVNAHIVVARLGMAPATIARSFSMVAETGVTPVELAERLIPCAGLRNLLVHRYGDIDVALLVGSVSEVVELFEDYVGHVARWISGAQAADAPER
jgi:uncharacterized protein YutE (UPF0331/DUF86 family)